MDPLSNIKFSEGEGSSNFLKFKAGQPVKLRVFTTDPIVSYNIYGNLSFTFAVWNWDEDRAMILSKGAGIAKQLSALHSDEDFGADITQIDIKIMPTGEELERKYTINPLPKSKALTDEQVEELTKLDNNLEKVIKNGLRAERYNDNPDDLPPPATTPLEARAAAAVAEEEPGLDDVFGSPTEDEDAEA